MAREYEPEYGNDRRDRSLFGGPAYEKRLHFLILTMPDKEIVSVSLREGTDFLDDLTADFYILETEGTTRSRTEDRPTAD